jgi:hypothetical protein
MIIREEMKSGLYGQILTWIIEILPYLEDNNLKPNWDITSPYYGQIFGKYLLLNYVPDSDDKEVSLTSLKNKFGKHHENDFEGVNKLWKKFFKFSPEIIDIVDNYIDGLDMKRTIGFHYRGTDKIGTEGGYINTDIFVKIVDDYLKFNKNIDNIIIFSDEKNALIELKNNYENKYNVIYDKGVYDSNFDNILFFNNIKNRVDIDNHYMMALRDTIVLSKCSVVFKTSSQMSAWPKIFNSSLEIYRISAFIHDWFPDSRIPLYKSENLEINKLLSEVYKKEILR